MQTTIDGASIHIASMNRLNSPNHILNNFLYDIWGYDQKPDGKPKRVLANGIFLDWATSHTTIRNNYIYNAGGMEIKHIMGNWDLDIDKNLTSKTRIEPPFLNELGPTGAASHAIDPGQLIHTGGVINSSDHELVKYSGAWAQTTVSGMAGLFEYNHLQAPPGQPATCIYHLPVTASGTYKICLMYFPNEKNASNATIKITHGEVEDLVEWDFQKGDRLGFAVELGLYNFEKDKPASVSISNPGADGFIVADGVGFIKIDE
jgi:hypothetical protein